MSDSDSFASIVTVEVIKPIKELCEYFSATDAHNELSFFANILFMLRDPGNELAVLEAVIELSKCRFVGLDFSLEAEEKINVILDQAITLSHTMSAPRDSHFS